MRRRSAIVAAACLVGACGEMPGVLRPEQAVMRAAAAAPAPAIGTYVLTIRASGRDRGRLFLNSELDYRDQRNLSLVVPRGVELALDARLGGDAAGLLIGRRVAATGAAVRVRIDFSHDGRPTGKYYYQTHLLLESEEQLRLLR